MLLTLEAWVLTWPSSTTVATAVVQVGINEPLIRIDVPDGQIREAQEWLEKKGWGESVVPRPVFEPSWDARTLEHFLKAFLVFDLACSAFFILIGHAIQQPPPKAVDDYLQSLAFSDAGWAFAYISYWPLTIFAVISSFLCLFYSRIGRLLFAITTVWGLIMALGPPPQIFGPGLGFLGSLHLTASNFALALMYWSPVRQKFDRESSP